MVLGEFTQKEKHIAFKNKRIRTLILNHIKKQIDKIDDTEMLSDDEIINLSLPYFLAELEQGDNNKKWDILTSSKEYYLVDNYDFIVRNIRRYLDAGIDIV